MLSHLLVVLAGLLWLGLLFGAALLGERHAARLSRVWPAIYALSLAVYCTSWTFYGTVTQAARSGWPIPPTFVGTILLYAFGFALLLKVVRLAREQNATSLADLIASRLGKDSWLAAVVTAVAVFGMIPYLALQLKAVAMSYGLLTRASELTPPPWQDSALWVALAMAVFAMLFGTRQASALEHNRGLVLAMAFESLLKLGAMLALGVFVWFGLSLPEALPVPPPQPRDVEGFAPLVLLGALAMFVLPHQFHVGVIECRETGHLRTARWLFPLYMLLIALPVLPLARAGDVVLAPIGVPSDLYVLALPLSQGHEALALLAFLGGLSAATGMVILATLSLSLMIGNHWLTPLLLRGAWSRAGEGDLRRAVLNQRRFGILALVLAAWAYSRAIAGSDALADIGAVSFSALAVLAPPLAFAIWRPRTPPRAVLWGLVASVFVWSWLLLVPLLMQAVGSAPDWLSQGPLGMRWLAPDSAMGLTGWSRLARALVLSLAVGTSITFLLAARGAGQVPGQAGVLDRASLRALAGRFLAPERLDSVLGESTPSAPVPADAESLIERELAAVLGAASTRLLLDAARREPGRDLDTVASLVDEAAQAFRFNQRLLEAALENMSQGISVVDGELRLVAWNARYAELFGFPSELLTVGRPVADLARHAIRCGFAGRLDEDAAIERRLAHMRAGTPHLSERQLADGSIIEIRGNPMPGGGFVATFTDVTAFRRAEAELKRVAESLEQRVESRTAELTAAKAEAERANRAKSRFLASVGHDLLQPLNAAQLFSHALGQQLRHAEYRPAVDNIRGALASAEGLIDGLLDISRLDAGGMVPQVEAFALRGWLAHLAAEFGVLAREKGLQLDAVGCSAWVRSDAQLLRRVLQNFLANAVRYTRSGRVLLGCRRRGALIEIEVWDTGPGIQPEDQVAIFEEFRRLQRGGQGLGLGLSIAERIARLLEHPLRLRSVPGRGTVFSILVPVAPPGTTASAALPEALIEQARLKVLVVDNDADVLRAMQALLEGWGCEVLTAATASQAEHFVLHESPDLWLLDFHLDDNAVGIDVLVRLRSLGQERPCIFITADQSEAVRNAILSAGAQVLNKPLKPLALRSLMRRLCGD